MNRRRVLVGIVIFALVGAFLIKFISGSTVSNKLSTVGSALDDGYSSSTGGSAQRQAVPAAEAPAQPAAPAAGGMSLDAAAPLDVANTAPAAQTNIVDPNRIVIKTATVEAQTAYEQLGETYRSVEQMITRLGGYIVSSDDSTSADRDAAYVVIAFRVPAASFDQALRGLEGEGVTIVRRDISGQDVTAEFVDNEAQIRNLEATAARLRVLLDKATTVNAAIEVNRTLSEYEGQIEVLKGRQKYLSDSAAMSLITLTLHSKALDIFVPTVPAIQFTFGKPSWNPVAVAERAWTSLLSLGQDLAELAIVIAIWIPVWLPLVLLARFVWRKYGRRPATPIVANK